jgi:hypothetical protein
MTVPDSEGKAYLTRAVFLINSVCLHLHSAVIFAFLCIYSLFDFCALINFIEFCTLIN